MKRTTFLAGCLLLAGCVRYPEPYRPPMQRRTMEISPQNRLSHFVAMNSPDAERHIVSGVLGLNDGAWRWCLKQAVFQFDLPDTKGKTLLVDLTVPELTFKQTGPVSIIVRVGTHVLDTLQFATHGQRTLEKPVPQEWLMPGAPIQVSLEASKVWTSPDDGAVRAFILSRIGFVE